MAGPFAAERLATFVRDIYKHHLPSTLHSELSLDDFGLKIKPSENLFASELVDAFAPLRDFDVKSRMQLGDAGDVLNDTFSQFLASSFVDEKELGQYLTPSEIVRMMVRLGVESLPDQLRFDLLSEESHARAIILDPSCGAGSFLAEATRWISEHHTIRSDKRQKVRHLLQTSVYGIDKSERMLKLALSSLTMLGATPANLHLANSLRRSGGDGELTKQIEGKSALILTNPPFGASFEGDDLLSYKLATDWSIRHPPSLDSELLFMERYADWLMPGGVLVTIVPDSILTNKGNFRALRDGLWDSLDILSVISLPAHAFAAAGTSTKTSILHARKLAGSKKRSRTYFGICEHIGYRVVTRKAQRMKVADQLNDLPRIFEGALLAVHNPSTTQGEIRKSDDRWDAGCHLCQPILVAASSIHGQEMISLSDIATLIREPFSIKGHNSKNFRYIEIGDIDGASLTVTAKCIATSEAPGRARKLVRAGDVLVSTVRPERRSIAVVPNHLDGAVCSNGIAVLRPFEVDPYLIAVLLRSDVVIAQMTGANLGIAYPAFDEEILPGIRLPLRASQITSALEGASRLHSLMDEVQELRAKVVDAVESMINEGSSSK
jgi:type I restriction enzyme S subunit